MGNTGQIIRSKTAQRYVTISNDVARSATLSLKARGLLIHLLSLPADWVIYKGNLYNAIKDKKGCIDSAFKELQKNGFILSVKVIDAKGRFSGWNHIVYDDPTDIQENRLRKNPTSDLTDFGENAPIQITDINTNEILITKDIIKTKGGVELSFNSEDWKEVWKEWTEYKQTEHRDQFKSTKSEQVAINKLVEMSSNDINTAKAIINQSIANRWKGLFTIKQNNNANTATTSKSNYDIIKERHERLDAYFSKIDELEGRQSIL